MRRILEMYLELAVIGILSYVAGRAVGRMYLLLEKVWKEK